MVEIRLEQVERVPCDFCGEYFASQELLKEHEKVRVGMVPVIDNSRRCEQINCCHKSLVYLNSSFFLHFLPLFFRVVFFQRCVLPAVVGKKQPFFCCLTCYFSFKNIKSFREHTCTSSEFDPDSSLPALIADKQLVCKKNS